MRRPLLLAESALFARRLGTNARSVYIETYGCQMNFNDTEVLRGILLKHRPDAFPLGTEHPLPSTFTFSHSVDEADVALLMTCSIRENAESKIWRRLEEIQAIKRRRKGAMVVGILGCMAERLKEAILEKSKVADIVCGPDAYKDMPRLLDNAFRGIHGVNVALSLEETYADVAPVRVDPESKSAFVSIMRGCNNIGRERSRSFSSIVEEVGHLAQSGVKEVTLLGQNVNSYNSPDGPHSGLDHKLSDGFRTIYKQSAGHGARLYELLDCLSLTYPEVRFRFTSPHPKDFPDHLLELIRDRPNICKQIHLPAQSGSTAVLERMRRGYTRESYLTLVDKIRSVIPNAALSSDFIVGFCGETERDHADTLSLVGYAKYDMAYLFAYSMREKTHAHRSLEDNVPEETKSRRLRQLIDLFYADCKALAMRYIGTRQLILIDGLSKKSELEFSGRADNNRTVLVPCNPIDGAAIAIGDYIEVEIVGTAGISLKGRPIRKASIAAFHSGEPIKLSHQ